MGYQSLIQNKLGYTMKDRELGIGNKGKGNRNRDCPPDGKRASLNSNKNYENSLVLLKCMMGLHLNMVKYT